MNDISQSIFSMGTYKEAYIGLYRVTRPAHCWFVSWAQPRPHLHNFASCATVQTSSNDDLADDSFAVREIPAIDTQTRCNQTQCYCTPFRESLQIRLHCADETLKRSELTSLVDLWLDLQHQ